MKALLYRASSTITEPILALCIAVLTQEQEDILRNLLLKDVTMMFGSIHFVLELSTHGIVYLMK